MGKWPERRRKLIVTVEHFFHIAGVYDADTLAATVASHSIRSFTSIECLIDVYLCHFTVQT